MRLNRLADFPRAGLIRAKVVEVGKLLDWDRWKHIRQHLDCRCNPRKVALPAAQQENVCGYLPVISVGVVQPRNLMMFLQVTFEQI